MNAHPFAKRSILRRAFLPIAGLALALSISTAGAQAMNCTDVIPQNPAKVFRSGLWKQWIFWSIPGPEAYRAVQRIAAEVNAARAGTGLPLLVPNPAYEIIVSVFDERNARGRDGSSISPATSNQEAFLAVFVDDTSGGSHVLFLSEPMRSNPALAATRGVPGVTAAVRRSVQTDSRDGVESIDTDWQLVTANGDSISFAARHDSEAVLFNAFAPFARVDYANCNLKYSTSMVFRSSPARTFDLFAREAAAFIDPSAKHVKLKVEVTHHDPLVHAIFNDPANVPELLIALDRDVRIQAR